MFKEQTREILEDYQPNLRNQKMIKYQLVVTILLKGLAEMNMVVTYKTWWTRGQAEVKRRVTYKLWRTRKL